MLSAEHLALLVTEADLDSESESDDDKAVGDYSTSDETSYILSSELLHHVSLTALPRPSPSEMDSLLLCDADARLDDDQETCGVSNDGEVSRTEEVINAPNVGESSNVAQGGSSNLKFDWCEVEQNFSDPDLPDFCELVGTTDEASSAKSPLECFQLFFTSTIISILVAQTNLYANTERAAKAPSPSNHWKDVVVDEMLAYLGIHIAMGIVNLPNVRDFWSTEPILQHQWFGSIMSRDRFKQILRYFDCADQSGYIPRGQDGYDPLYKIRDVIDILLERFQALYNPNRELSIDESMIGTKCRVPFLQYMPKNQPMLKQHMLQDLIFTQVKIMMMSLGKD